VKVHETSATVGYIDLVTVRSVDGNVRSVHELLDLKNPTSQFNGARSKRYVIEYDCKNKLERTVSVTGYSDRMAKGRITDASEREQGWYPIGPDSYHVRQLGMVCGG